MNPSQFWSHLAAGATGAIVVSIVLATVQVLADQSSLTDDVPRLIPYNGVLEFDGQPVTLTGGSAPTMTFDICDSSDCSSISFSQSMSVNVYNGSFSALIGEDNASGTVNPSGTFDTLQDAISAADDLYMRINVNDGSGDVELSNPQRLLVTAHAVYATNATYFSIARDAVIGANNSASHTVNGNMDFNHTINVDGNALLGNGSADSHRVRGNMELVHTMNVNGAVTLGDGSGDSHTVNGNVDFNDTLNVDGVATIGDANTDRHILNGTLVFAGASGDTGLATDGSIVLDSGGNRSMSIDENELQVRDPTTSLSAPLHVQPEGGQFYVNSNRLGYHNNSAGAVDDYDCVWTCHDAPGSHRCANGSYLAGIGMPDNNGSEEKLDQCDNADDFRTLCCALY